MNEIYYITNYQSIRYSMGFQTLLTITINIISSLDLQLLFLAIVALYISEEKQCGFYLMNKGAIQKYNYFGMWRVKKQTRMDLSSLYLTPANQVEKLITKLWHLYWVGLVWGYVGWERKSMLKKHLFLKGIWPLLNSSRQEERINPFHFLFGWTHS